MKGKTSFTAYCDWIEVFEELNNEDAGMLIKHILRYVNDENPTPPNVLIKVAFASIKATLKRDLTKWEKIVERNKANGSKGGRPKKPKKPTGLKGNPTKPKKADSDRDSDSDRHTQSVRALKAFQFLEDNHPARLEQEFKLLHWRKIPDKEDFIESFNDKVDLEEIPFEATKLLARIRGFAKHWIKNRENEVQPAVAKFKPFQYD